MARTRNPVVVVSGASAGLGRASAVHFARKGWDVGLLARGRAGLDGAAADVRDAGGRAHAITCDVSDAAAVDDAAGEFEHELGPVDVWVNNAMATVYGRFDDLSPEEFRRVVDVTFLGSVWGTRAALSRMRDRDRGVIVQVGSALGERGIPLQSAYCASKHALNGLIDSVRSELIDEGSNVALRVAQMPALNTPQFAWGRNRLGSHPQPVPPIFQPEVAARAVWHLATHDRREIWVGGSTVETIVGERASAAALDHYLASNAVEAQKASGRERPRLDNLFEPADQDHDFGAHGPFDDDAKKRSLQLGLTRRRGLLTTVAATVAGTVAAWWWNDRQD